MPDLWGWDRDYCGWGAICCLQWVCFPGLPALLWVWKARGEPGLSSVQDQIQTYQRWDWLCISFLWLWYLVTVVEKFLTALMMNELQVVPGLKAMKRKMILMTWTMSLIMGILMLWAHNQCRNPCILDALTLGEVLIMDLAWRQTWNMARLLSILTYRSWLMGRRYYIVEFLFWRVWLSFCVGITSHWQLILTNYCFCYL